MFYELLCFRIVLFYLSNVTVCEYCKLQMADLRWNLQSSESAVNKPQRFLLTVGMITCVVNAVHIHHCHVEQPFRLAALLHMSNK